jgi:ribosome maturation factor RimP
MIDKNVVTQLVDEWLEGKDYFLVSVAVSPDDRIVIEIDHAEGVWIDDCVQLSRFVEERLDREKEDFELEVGSAGLGQPFKVWRQYAIHVGKEVETLTKEGKKLRGVLTAADEEGFRIEVEKKVKPEGEKRPRLVNEELAFKYDEIKYTKYLISFK